MTARRSSVNEHCRFGQGLFRSKAKRGRCLVDMTLYAKVIDSLSGDIQSTTQPRLQIGFVPIRHGGPLAEPIHHYVPPQLRRPTPVENAPAATVYLGRPASAAPSMAAVVNPATLRLPTSRATSAAGIMQARKLNLPKLIPCQPWSLTANTGPSSAINLPIAAKSTTLACTSRSAISSWVRFLGI